MRKPKDNDPWPEYDCPDCGSRIVGEYTYCPDCGSQHEQLEDGTMPDGTNPYA